MKSNASKYIRKNKVLFVFFFKFNSILFLLLMIVCVLLLGNSLDL
uniref:Uncharacterized protein n=1 Tax=Anguilla anguilla TaxID=7936 RepID=A0A0E9PRV5_ANGAN